jgi:hypothetical protein
MNKVIETHYHSTRWFKYDRDCLCVNKSQFVPVIFEPPCTTQQSPSLSCINLLDNILKNVGKMRRKGKYDILWHGGMMFIVQPAVRTFYITEKYVFKCLKVYHLTYVVTNSHLAFCFYIASFLSLSEGRHRMSRLLQTLRPIKLPRSGTR